jgi:hypothetical protein
MAILLALTVLALLPCLVVFVIFADAFLNTVRIQRSRIVRVGRPADRPLVVASAAAVPDAAITDTANDSELSELSELPEAIGPPLEQIAAEIHRLSYARRTAAADTARFIAATRAYDRRLGHACRALEIDEHLNEVSGFDREVERLRVEGLLLDAGFVLDTDSARPA